MLGNTHPGWIVTQQLPVSLLDEAVSCNCTPSLKLLDVEALSNPLRVGHA